jgi:DNA (cytosine-5)-methyltransferase 1
VTKPRLLDLFCGAGGAAMGYSRAGFEVVGVDINLQPHYPFEFHQADAMTYPLDGFDVIHASPPCQAYTRKAASWGRARNHWLEHPDLLGPTRELLIATGLPYVIETGDLFNASPPSYTEHVGRPLLAHLLEADRAA